MRKIIVVSTTLLLLVAFWIFYLKLSHRGGPGLNPGRMPPPAVASGPNPAAKAVSQSRNAPGLPTEPSANPAPAPTTVSVPTTGAQAAGGKISESALRQIEALLEEKASRTPTQNKIDSQLLFARKLSRNEPIAEGLNTLRVELDRDQADRVLVDIKATVSEDLLADIRQRGGNIINSFAQYQAIRAGVPLSEMENLAARADVIFVGPAVRRTVNTGSVNSEGDVAEKANLARSSYGVTGTGVKVGVISDSVDYITNSQALGDLGTVTVLAGQSGVPDTGEGTAMLEIVHDLAPGAALYFATANGGNANFANNIRQLRAAGCDIIIDDMEYFNESPFQDAVIAQAVNDVTAAGALYFSSASNSGNKDDGTSATWEGDFLDSGQTVNTSKGVGKIHSFGSAIFNVGTSSSQSETANFFWADPLGHSTNDYDIFILDATGTSLVAASTTTQNGTQDPYEKVKVDNGELMVVVLSTGTGRFLHLENGRGRLSVSTAGRTKGHACAANAFGVAAVSAHGLTTPFTAAAKVETFSSDGPRRVFFYADGTAITPGNFSATGGTVRQKPDLAAADGVATAVPGFQPFYGTSAAAPHAGAIAALLKARNPGLTTSEARAALTSGVLDIEAAGVDRNSGFGLLMADLVVQAAGTAQPPTITGFSPTNGPVGTGVSISGTKFSGATAVKFNGVSATFTVNSSTNISATVPTSATTGTIAVTTPGGTATSAASFAVSTAPAVTGFVPSSGNIGTTVIITGANFTGTTNVSFNGVSASFAVNSSVQITATVPVGATTGRIRVSSPGGVADSAGVFTVATAPVISGFSPASGPIGSSVTITGANFVSVNSVAINGVAVVSPVVNSAAQITATVPAAATTGPISVTTASGTAQSASNFTVVSPPVISGFTPNTGGAGTVVTINGTGFNGATAVKFNALDAASFSVNSATQIIASAASGVTTGPLSVTTPGGTVSSAANFAVVSVPANDNFAFAQTVTGSSGTASGNNTLATKEVGEPNHAGNPGGKSVWYAWTAPSSGTWTFDTVGSSFDTLLAVYTGSTVSNLTLVAANDDILARVVTNSRLAFVASAGTAYRIAVDGFSTGSQSGSPVASGTVTLNWAPSATVPAISSISPSSATVGASVTITGANFIGVTNVSFNGASAVFAVNSSTQIAATVPAAATVGPITVSAPGGTAVSTASFTPTSGGNNDAFANALVITGSSGSVNSDNLTATKEAGEPDHAGNTGGTSVWFAWTAPSSGLWTFDTSGSSFDTLLAIYTGITVGNLTVIASNDDWSGAVTSQAPFNAIGGTTYRIAVDGYGGASGSIVLNWNFTPNQPLISSFTPTNGSAGASVTINGQSLNGAIAVQFHGVNSASFTNNSSSQVAAVVPAGASTGLITLVTSNGTAQSASVFVVTGNPPANDNFNNRIAIVGAVKTVTGSNIGATKEVGEPNHAGNAGGDSVWWTWTAPSNGTYTVTTRGSSFDTTLGVYTGTSVWGLTTIAYNDDGPNMGTASLLSFFASAGTAYQIAVDGYNAASGSIVLSVYPGTASQLIYYTGFEAIEGYSTFFPLAGQDGWTSFGTGQNGVVFDYFYDYSQQAYVGVSSTSPGKSLFVWHPLNYTPNTNTLPVAVFSTYMEIVDSTDYLYDDFGWEVFNIAGQSLFFLDFDNSDLGVYYLLNDGSDYHYTGQDFQNGYIYYLQVTMDFGRNLWSASLDGTTIIQNQPISATNTVTRNLGDIDATWLQTSGTYGNNYMLFDDYYVSGQPSQAPRIITPPQNTVVTVGYSTNLLVVADSPLALSYQWQFNGANLAGATGPTLAVNNVTLGQAGSYTVIVTNSSGSVTSAPALLTVAQMPNLAPYKPAGWSDKIVAATNTSSTVDAGIIYRHQDVYVSWAVVNTATNGNITSRFYSAFYLDGVVKHNWYTDGLNAGYYTYVTNFDVGKLAMGLHTLRLDTDTTGVVAESNENDNSYTKTIIVSSTNDVPPQLGSSSRTRNGPFQFTLTGIPLRSYEIQASTNLTNWQVLATLVNSNGNGALQYTDPGATNLARRFYRSRLLSP
jgi:hypothetical protein